MTTDRIWKLLTVTGACVMLSGCYSCSLNGGWERQMNPFCTEGRALRGAVAPAPLTLGAQITNETAEAG